MIGKSVVRAALTLVLGQPTMRLQHKIFREARRALRLDQPEFPGKVRLPPGFGRNLPERVVELFLTKHTYVPGARVLDVGHSNIMECHRRLLATLEPPIHLTGIDIATPAYDTSAYYEHSIIADITATGLPAGSFDIIWCISTLEHVGMDNSGYTGNSTAGAGMDVVAIREMGRLLSPGGRLLITVPFGMFEDHGWFRNYDADSWQGLLAAVRPVADVHELYFMYEPALGWQTVDRLRLATTRYHDHANAGAAGLAAAVINRIASPASHGASP
jgi:SAM-dependent methyltransferase